jgi:hypothetical protein
MAHENHPGGQLVGRYKHQIETSKIKINQDCAGILDPLNLITLRNRPDSSLLSELRAAYNEFIIARALGLEFVQQQRIRSKRKSTCILKGNVYLKAAFVQAANAGGQYQGNS